MLFRSISFYDSSGQSDFGFTKPYSEKTAELIDQEVKEIIDESYQRARDVLQNNISGLTELAEILLEKEVIFSEDLEKIFGKRKADILKEERESAEEALKTTDKKEKEEIGKEKSVKSTDNLKTVEGKEKSEKNTGKKQLRKSKPSVD